MLSVDRITTAHVGDELGFEVRDPSSVGLQLCQKSLFPFHVLTSRELPDLTALLLQLFLPIALGTKGCTTRAGAAGQSRKSRD